MGETSEENPSATVVLSLCRYFANVTLLKAVTHPVLKNTEKTDNQRFQGIPFKRLDDRHWRCTLPQDRSQGCQFVYISKQMRWFQQSMLFHISTFLNKSWKLNCFMIVMISGCCNSQWRSQGEIRSRRSGEFGLTRIRRIGSLLLKYLSRKILFEITYNYNQTKFR